MSTVACGSGVPSVSQNCWPTRWISLCLHWEHILGRQKNILVYRPAQGGGAGLLRLQNKTAPEPLAAPELLVLQNKTAPEPPLPYFGGSTSKKLRQNRHYLILDVVPPKKLRQNRHYLYYLRKPLYFLNR